jgi:protein O-GlcNAc transferase
MLRCSGMRRIIAFSLYNAQAKYTVNAVINCMLAPAVYPGWVCRFYVDDTVPLGIVALLRSFEHVELVPMPRHQDAGAMLWRFLPAGEPGVDAMISRDADSWLPACTIGWLAGGSST